MTSGVALAATRSEQQNCRVESTDDARYWKSSNHGPFDPEVPKLGEETKAGTSTKKRPPAPINPTAPVSKKMRTVVRRTHSPKTVPSVSSSSSITSRVRKVTPNVVGMKEVARHLLKPRTLLESQLILAVPTECTYEVCTAIPLDRRILSNPTESKCVNNLLGNLKSISSSEQIHVYLQHHNIKQIDKLLEFPKKKYATRQNPKDCVEFNETRLIFQKLADQFWPGPVSIFLSPQSTVPDSLLKKAYIHKQYVGFRCPSHPLAVKVLKQVHQSTPDPVVLMGSPVYNHDSALLKAKDVNEKFAKSKNIGKSSIQILQGEERKEIFSVPTCQYKDEWLECWIVPEKRIVVLRGKSKRNVSDAIKQTLRNHNTKNRVKKSVLQHWRVYDDREKSPTTK